MFVVKYRKIWFGISALLFAISIFAMFTYGFKLSIDFKGGTITEAKYLGDRPDKESIEEKISALNIGGFSVRPSGETNYIVRSRELNESERISLLSALGISSTTNGTIERQNTIGPVAGSQLQGKAVKAIGTVVLMIVLFITFAFRGVSKPVSSWKYGFATIIALLHDVIIPLGLFVILGHFFNIEIDLLFVTGILAVLGYSVHDTIVVFDRVRENLTINTEKKNREDFETTVGKSVAQTFGRSINTSLTIFITLLALYIFGSSATKEFSLLLLVGVVIGTYSSIFIASPLLVVMEKFKLDPRGVWVNLWLVISVGLIQTSKFDIPNFKEIAVVLTLIFGFVLYKLSIKTDYLNDKWRKIIIGALSIVIVSLVTGFISGLINT